jgi:hypothetical protein
MRDIVERLQEEAMRLSGRSLDRGCAESGIAANLADEAVSEIERLREALAGINRILSPGNRTLDAMIRDMGYACDTARLAIKEPTT